MNKLTISQVKEIKELIKLGERVTRIGKKYNVSYVTICDIKNGRSWVIEEKSIPNSKNRVGQVFGRLTVIAFDHSRNGENYWLCLCECGKTNVVSGTSLTHRASRSCGCAMKLPYGEAAFRQCYSGYRTQAKKRKIEFSISEEKFREITSMECHYCGSKPGNEYKAKRPKDQGTYIYNGIDRKDNSIGYIESNCLPCCFTCNFAKMDKTYESFLGWADRMSLFRCKTINQIS